MTDVKEIPGTYGEYVARLARSSPVSGNLYGNTIAQTESSVKGSMRNVDPDTTGAASTATTVAVPEVAVVLSSPLLTPLSVCAMLSSESHRLGGSCISFGTGLETL